MVTEREVERGEILRKLGFDGYGITTKFGRNDVEKIIDGVLQESKQKFLVLIEESRGLFVTDGSWTFFRQKVEEEF